jgi:predicted kinase
MKIIIMRGIPGAGKSTWAKNNHPNSKVVSADDFFTNDEGEYIFDPSRIGEADGRCFLNAIHYLQMMSTAREADIVVDNTNATEIEIAPYVLLAQAYGVEHEIVTLLVDPQVAYERSLHGASHDTVHQIEYAMLSARIAPWWNHRTIEV